jgi:hypothetical protein
MRILEDQPAGSTGLLSTNVVNRRELNTSVFVDAWGATARLKLDMSMSECLFSLNEKLRNVDRNKRKVALLETEGRIFD